MEKSKIYFSEFLIGVGSSPVWTLTNVGIKSIVIEEKLFSINPYRSGFYIGVDFFLPMENHLVLSLVV
jgi:hypothetical protein